MVKRDNIRGEGGWRYLGGCQNLGENRKKRKGERRAIEKEKSRRSEGGGGGILIAQGMPALEGTGF